MCVTRPTRLLALPILALVAGLFTPTEARAGHLRVDAHAMVSPAELSVTHGSFRYVAATSLAQLAVLRPDGTQAIIHLPGVASALFVHENQLYVGFPSGDLQVFNVLGDAAANPVLTLRHRYPHAVAGFALTNGQVVALPAQGASAPSNAQPTPAPSAPPKPAGPPEPKSGVGLLILGAIVGGGVGVPTFAIGLNRRLDREGDGIGLLSVGGTALGVGAIMIGIGASQAANHRRWAKKQYSMRVTPSFYADRRGNWSVGANWRF